MLPDLSEPMSGSSTIQSSALMLSKPHLDAAHDTAANGVAHFANGSSSPQRNGHTAATAGVQPTPAPDGPAPHAAAPAAPALDAESASQLQAAAATTAEPIAPANTEGAGGGGDGTAVSPNGAAAQASSGAQPVDPDYVVPDGSMTETQVWATLPTSARLDRYGFVLSAAEPRDQPQGSPERGGRSAIGAGSAPVSAAASTSGPAPKGLRSMFKRSTGRLPSAAATTMTAPSSIAHGSHAQLGSWPGSRWGPLRRGGAEEGGARGAAGAGGTGGGAEDRDTALRRLRKWRRMLGPEGGRLASYLERKPAKVKRRVRKGIPEQLRGLAWHHLSGGAALLAANPGEFARLADLGPAMPPLEREVDTSIMRDLNRTFPTHIYYMHRHGQGQRGLYMVLRAYALYDPGVGYVQGMGFMAAVLLLYMNAEEAFWTLVALLRDGPSGRTGMRGLYLPGVPQLRCCLHQFKGLLADAAPRLAAHMDREGVEPVMIATHWFNTAFAYTMPFTHLLRVWDVLMLEGSKVVFRVGLAVLQSAEPRLLRLPFEQLAEALGPRALPALVPPRPEDMLRRALRLPVSKRLEQLRAEWQAEQEAQGRNSQGNRAGRG